MDRQLKTRCNFRAPAASRCNELSNVKSKLKPGTMQQVIHTQKDDWSVSGSHWVAELLEKPLSLSSRNHPALTYIHLGIYIHIYCSLIFCRVGDVNLLIQLTDRKIVTQARKPVRRCTCFYPRLACIRSGTILLLLSWLVPLNLSIGNPWSSL
jgi:hypothetical protein